MNSKILIDKIVKDYENLKFGFGGDSYYPELIDTYVRTVKDIHQLQCHRSSLKKILEIGAFTGIVSTALARSGLNVTAHDIPRVSQDPELLNHYKSEGVEAASFLLQKHPLPFEDNKFDLIVFCEVLEHLNFNPIPLAQEFKRILKPGGFLYVATPNQTSLIHRLMILRGKSFYYPMEYLREGVDPASLQAFGYHWHEFTKREMLDLFVSEGLDLRYHYYCRYVNKTNSSLLRRSAVGAIYKCFPQFMQCQVALFQNKAGGQ